MKAIRKAKVTYAILFLETLILLLDETAKAWSTLWRKTAMAIR